MASDTIHAVNEAPLPLELEMASTGNAKAPSPTNKDDPYLVTFALPFDDDNPLDWPNGKKWSVTDVLSATGFNRIMVSTIMAPALPTIARELHMNSTESAMALSSTSTDEILPSWEVTDEVSLKSTSLPRLLVPCSLAPCQKSMADR